MAKTIQARKVQDSPPTPCRRLLVLRNLQRRQRLDMRLLRHIVRVLLERVHSTNSFDLAIYLVSRDHIIRLNETFLRHKGPTDVIAFDYRAGAPAPPVGDRQDPCPAAEVFVCLDEAMEQARRFRTTWQRELVRYLVHGILHLLGYNDQDPRSRRRMKRVEDALVGTLAAQFDLRPLSPA